jgi:hypothetical protein
MGKRDRRRRERVARKKRGGALMGMRSGFQRAAKGVSSPSPKSRGGRAVNALITIVLLAAAAFLILRRFR